MRILLLLGCITGSMLFLSLIGSAIDNLCNCETTSAMEIIEEEFNKL